MFKKIIPLFFFCLFYGAITMGTIQQHSIVDEYELKAAFLYNFTKYIIWSGEQNENEFIIGILGNSPISPILEEIAKTETVNGKKIIIRHFRKPVEIDWCNILFITKQNSFPVNEIISKISTGTLTVGEIDGAAKQGIAMNFVIENNNLKFECNLHALYSAGLNASSQLLKLAIIIDYQ